MSSLLRKKLNNKDLRDEHVVMFSPSRSDAVGGMETVYAHLAKYLREGGYNVTTLHGGEMLQRVGEAAWEIPLEVLRTRRRIPRPGSIVRIGRSYWDVFRLLRRLSPTVVHVHFVGAESLYFMSLRRVFGYRVVVTAHGSDIRHHYNPVSRRLQPYVLRHADMVTAVSDPLARLIFDKSGREAHVIPNGIDLDFWQCPEVKPRRDLAPTVVSVGRLEKVKGTDVLVHAFSEVVRRVPQARLVVIGEGTLRPKLEQLIRDIGLANHIELAGEMKPQDIRERLHAADVLAMPSRNEAFGLAALEGMAAGLPVVGSAVGGLPDLVGEGGVLVPPDQPSALAEALATLLTDDELRERTAVAAVRQAEGFSWAHSAEAYESVLMAG